MEPISHRPLVPKYKQLASTIQARLNCIQSHNQEWQDNHEATIKNIINSLPHGSGIDSKTEINLDKSMSDKIIIRSSYHCMDSDGYYTHWIDFTVTIEPSLQFDFNLDIIGKFGKDQDIKNYLYDTFYWDLKYNYVERD